MDPGFDFMELSPANPMRPADWRWRMARFASADRRLVPESWLDSTVRTAARLAAALERHEMRDSELEGKHLFERFSTLYPAYEIYRRSDSTRWELEARLLSDAAFDQTATACLLPRDVVESYHQVFFLVPPPPHNPIYLLDAVMGTRAICNVSEADYPLMLKIAACRGPHMLDRVLRHYRQPPVLPVQIGQLGADARKDLAAALMTKALVLSWTKPLTPEMMARVVKLRDMSAKLDRADAAADPTIEPLAEEIRATIPFPTMVAGSGVAATAA